MVLGESINLPVHVVGTRLLAAVGPRDSLRLCQEIMQYPHVTPTDFPI